MHYFLGVDAGGTTTKSVIIDENSTTIGEISGGPANYHNIGLLDASTNVISTIAQLLEKTKLTLKQLTWVTIGIVSCDTKKDYERLWKVFTTDTMQPIAPKLTMVRDAVVGLYSGSPPPAVVAICGTGSLAYGINDHGDAASAGNWGHFLGDQGSGYQLGKRMFERVVACYDGTGEATLLTQKLENRLRVKSSADVLDWYNDTKPTVHVISDFAPLVIQAAEEGDEVSRQLLDETVGNLGKAVMAVLKKLKMEDEAVRLVTSGGLFESKYFRALFEGHMTALIKHVRLIKPLVSPAVGAAIMAKHEWEKKEKPTY